MSPLESRTNLCAGSDAGFSLLNFFHPHGADLVFGYLADRVESRVGQDIRVGLHEVEAHEDRARLHEIGQEHLADDFTRGVTRSVPAHDSSGPSLCRVKRVDFHMTFRHLSVRG